MLKRLKNFLIYCSARALMGLVRCLSWEHSLRFGAWVGRLAYKVANGVRRDTLTHLELAFPSQSLSEREQLAREMFEHLGRAAAEVVNIEKVSDIRKYVRIDPALRTLFENLLVRGRGVVLVTGHIGNWELMARALVAEGFPLYAIGKRSYDGRITTLIQEFRDQGKVNTIWRGDSDAFEKMMAVTKLNAVLGVLIDQDTKVQGVFVPFFDCLAHTPTAAAVLARKTGAAVITGFNYREPEGGFRIVGEEYVPVNDNDFNRAVMRDTAAMTARIEAHIRAHPGEWVWMHRRWKTRPPNEGRA
jgi:KDO2-lipid IV(A) lauroyltransferase